MEAVAGVEVDIAADVVRTAGAAVAGLGDVEGGAGASGEDGGELEAFEPLYGRRDFVDRVGGEDVGDVERGGAVVATPVGFVLDGDIVAEPEVAVGDGHDAGPGVVGVEAW